MPYNDAQDLPKKKPLASVKIGCGRLYLEVGGVIVAMETDKCRDGNFPEDIYPEIPDYELESAFIGDKPAKDLPLSVVRYFRGDVWDEKMLEYAAKKINEAVDSVQ